MSPSPQRLPSWRASFSGGCWTPTGLWCGDGYDLCAAFRHEPEAATRLVQEAKQRRGEDMGCLCATVKGAGRRIIEGRPLQEPVHEDLAHDPWGEFVRLVESVPLPAPARPDE